VATAVRVGLVGCGRIARVHCGYLREVPEVDLVGVWDLDPVARRRLAGETGLPCFETLDELLEFGRPDAVHVLTPPQRRADLAIGLLEAGVGVLIEKPLAMNAAEADRILAASQKTGRWVTVDHNRWFDPVVQAAAARLERGWLGRLVGVDILQSVDVGAARGTSVAELPGGVVHDLAPHPLYLMRRFAGVVRSLQVVLQQGNDGMLEEVRLVGIGEKAPASVTITTGTRPFMNRLTLFGSEASVEVNLNNMTLIERRPKHLPKILGKVWPNVSEAGQLLWATVENGIAFATGRQRYYPGIGVHLRQLYENLAAGKAPPVTPEEGRDVVAWYDEILARAREMTEGLGRAK